MLHFTKVLHVEDYGFLYFSFKCTHSAENNRCQVEVWTKGEQCHHFSMNETHGRWTIVKTPSPPQWIVGLEPALERIICEYQPGSSDVPSKFRLLQSPDNPAKTGS